MIHLSFVQNGIGENWRSFGGNMQMEKLMLLFLHMCMFESVV